MYRNPEIVLSLAHPSGSNGAWVGLNVSWKGLVDFIPGRWLPPSILAEYAGGTGETGSRKNTEMMTLPETFSARKGEK